MNILRVALILLGFFLYLILITTIPLLLYQYFGITDFWIGLAMGAVEVVLFVLGYVIVIRRCYTGD